MTESRIDFRIALSVDGRSATWRRATIVWMNAVSLIAPVRGARRHEASAIALMANERKRTRRRMIDGRVESVVMLVKRRRAATTLELTRGAPVAPACARRTTPAREAA